jgi:PAS domain S-box-containing protein
MIETSPQAAATPDAPVAEPPPVAQPAREADTSGLSLLDELPAAVYTTDAAGRILHCNAAAIELWGRSPVIGVERWCGAHQLYGPEGAALEPSDCPMARVLRGMPVESGAEIVIERPDGSRRHVLAHPSARRDEQGRIVGAVNMLVDITPRKEAEAELSATRNQLATQVEGLTQLHELAMCLGGITELQPALEAILAAAVEGQGADFGLVWLHDAESGQLVAQASRNFDAQSLLLFTRIPPGSLGGSAGHAFASSRRWIVADTEADASFEPYRPAARRAGFRAVHSTPIVTRSGTLLGVISVHYKRPRVPLRREMQLADVCARHAADAIEAYGAQQRLRESERLYRAIGESIDFGVWVCDATGRNVYQSESMLKLLGRSAEEHRSAGWGDVLHPEEREAFRAAWAQCVKDGTPWDSEQRILGADGAWHPILVRGSPVRNERGQIVSWAGIALDIARLKHVETELRELDQRKNEFLATLAHELRNPLAPLRNGLEVMRLASSDAQTVEKARGMMERQLAQMVRLVDDLLDVSRVSRGRIELRRADVELGTVLRNALETCQPMMDERGHKLVANLPRERFIIHGDVTRLSQVFWNVLNNAAKYTACGGRVELTVTGGAGEVEVSVKDNGVGIPAHMLGQVFDIFTQLDRSLEKSQGGLGIGLSIARRLVQMHGGTIEARSAGHGKGSEFVIRLPARVEAAPAMAEPPARAAAPGAARKRILIADDNPDSAMTLSIMLEVMGNEVSVARDGDEAVAMAEALHPDAILLDIGMPKLNGYEACERIRARAWAAQTFIVALTGWGQEEDKARSRDAGFDRHLVKPVEPATLEKMIGELVCGARRR